MGFDLPHFIPQVPNQGFSYSFVALVSILWSLFVLQKAFFLPQWGFCHNFQSSCTTMWFVLKFSLSFLFFLIQWALFFHEAAPRRFPNLMNLWVPWIHRCYCQEECSKHRQVLLTTKGKMQSMPLQLTIWICSPGPQEVYTKCNNVYCWLNMLMQSCCRYNYPVLQVSLPVLLSTPFPIPARGV